MISHVVFCDVLSVLPVVVNPLFLVLCQTKRVALTPLRTWKPSWALGESQCCSLASWCRRSTRSSRQRTASAVSSCSCKMFQDVSRTLVGHWSEWMAKAVKSFRQFRTKCIQATVYLSEDAFSSLSSGMLSKATFCVTQRPEAWQKQVTMILP